MSKSFQISGREIGPGAPVYIIAEMSANHNQSLEQALQIVKEAKTSGADAIKLQTYTADTMTIASDRPEFRVGDGSLWAGQNLHALYQQAFTPWKWQPQLKAEADRLGLHCFSSPFDFSAVEFLENMRVPAYKVASFELVDIPLIQRIARTGKPIIMSTGMATLPEIEEAVAAAREAGGDQIALLKCNSAYPAPPEEMNLRTIPDMAKRFDVPVGLSDHTMGIASAVASVALGACIIEKHFTLSRADRGPDSAFSLEPMEFKMMVDAVREAERALGGVSYTPSPREQVSRVYRRSLFVVEEVKEGETLTERHVRSIRPGHGLPPKELPSVLGRKAARAIQRGEPLTRDMLRD